MNLLDVLTSSVVVFYALQHNARGPILIGHLDQIFDLAPQRKVRLKPDQFHKNERKKYYNFAFGCILLALLVIKLFTVLSVFAQFRNLFPVYFSQFST